MKLGLKDILILALAGGLLFLWFFGRGGSTEIDDTKYIEIGGKRYKQLLERTEVKYIPVVKKGLAYKPVPSTITLSKPEPLPQVIDTAKIIREYYTKNYFEDRQAIDTIGFVTIKDTIYNNTIFSRQLDFDYELPVKTITVIAEEPPRNHVYLGGGLNFDSVQLLNSGYVGALFKTKKDRIIGAQVGAANLDGQVSPYIGGSLYWKLSFRKK